MPQARFRKPAWAGDGTAHPGHAANARTSRGDDWRYAQARMTTVPEIKGINKSIATRELVYIANDGKRGEN